MEAVSILLILFTAMPIYAQDPGDLYSSMWDKGVAVILYQDQFGTGWWVDRTHLVTAAHVVDFQSNARVIVMHGDYEARGTAIYVNQLHDIAVIRVDREPTYQYIWSLSRKDPEKALKIFVIGYPYELYKIVGDMKRMSTVPRVAQGIVAWVHSDKKIFEFQAATDSGNSGGPIVDEDGNVVGVVSFALRGNVAVLYYGTSVSAVKEALDRLGIRYRVGLASPEIAFDTSQPILIAALTGVFAALLTVIILVPVMVRRPWARP